MRGYPAWGASWMVPVEPASDQGRPRMMLENLLAEGPLLREGLLDRPWAAAGKAEFDPEPVALCEQTAYCGRVVALGA